MSDASASRIAFSSSRPEFVGSENEGIAAGGGGIVVVVVGPLDGTVVVGSLDGTVVVPAAP
ncbi:MAG TPA: hypothetical protein VL119_07700 [Acidimicrobiia bacterium]|nr:hypothetical protein [Acidimicrobiia bacterium]